MAIIVCDDPDDIRNLVSKSVREADDKTKKSKCDDDNDDDDKAQQVEAEVASTSTSSSSSSSKYSSMKENRRPRSDRKIKKIESKEFQNNNFDKEGGEDNDDDASSSSKKKRVRGGRRRVSKSDDDDLIATADNELDIVQRSSRKGRSSKSSLQVALSMRREQEKKQHSHQQQQEEDNTKTKRSRSKTPPGKRESRNTSLRRSNRRKDGDSPRPTDENNCDTIKQKNSVNVSKSTRGSRRTKSAKEESVIPHSHTIEAVSETKSPKPRSKRSSRTAQHMDNRTSETPRRSSKSVKASSTTRSHTIGAVSEAKSPKPRSNSRSVRATKSGSIEKLAKSIDMDIITGKLDLDATKMMKPKSPPSSPRPTTTSVGVEKLAKSAVELSQPQLSRGSPSSVGKASAGVEKLAKSAVELSQPQRPSRDSPSSVGKAGVGVEKLAKSAVELSQPQRPSRDSPSSVGKVRSKSITGRYASSRRSKSTTPIRSRRRSSFESPVLPAKSFLLPTGIRGEIKQDFLFDDSKVITLEESFEALWKGEDKNCDPDAFDDDHDYKDDINIDDDIEDDDVQNNNSFTDNNQQMKELQENKSSTVELHQQIASLQRQLKLRDNECMMAANQLNEFKHENKLLTIELDGMFKKQEDREQNRKISNLNSGDENIEAATNLREAEDRIKILENELEDTNKVSKLQLEELDDEMKILNEKIKLQQKETDQKLELKDTIISELQTKVRHLEASMNETTDVDTIESAKQKVYEARADATSVREKLVTFESMCQQLQETNNELMIKNMQLEQTNADRGELEKKVVERTQDAHEWKIRAEEAERKILTITNNSVDKRISTNNNSNASNQQDMSLQAALAKSSNNNTNNNNNGRRWGIFGGGNNINNNATNVDGSNNLPVTTDESRNDRDSNTAINQIRSLNNTIAALQSEIVQLSSKQKEESYIQKKKIMQLEGENEALVLQNATLEKLSRFHDDK